MLRRQHPADSARNGAPTRGDGSGQAGIRRADPVPSSVAYSVPVAVPERLAASGDPTPTPEASPTAEQSSPAAAHTRPVAAHTSPVAVAPSSPAPSPTSRETRPPREVQFGGDGATVRGRADAAKLHGTSRAFRRFIVATVPQPSNSCPNRGSINVQAWRADGFAVGDVSACGGYRAIWGTDGTASWRRLIGAQDLWSCDDLKRYRVPTSIAGDKCASGGRLQEYHHA